MTEIPRRWLVRAVLVLARIVGVVALMLLLAIATIAIGVHP